MMAVYPHSVRSHYGRRVSWKVSTLAACTRNTSRISRAASNLKPAVDPACVAACTDDTGETLSGHLCPWWLLLEFKLLCFMGCHLMVDDKLTAHCKLTLAVAVHTRPGRGVLSSQGSLRLTRSSTSCLKGRDPTSSASRCLKGFSKTASPRFTATNMTFTWTMTAVRSQVKATNRSP